MASMCPLWQWETLVLLAIEGSAFVPDASEAEIPGCRPRRGTAELSFKIWAQERIFLGCAGNLAPGWIQKAWFW